MAVVEGRTWLEVLAPPVCWGLLREEVVGRIAFMTGGKPEILPVNYAVDGETIVFRTERGTKLDSVAHAPAVAFEVDRTDPAGVGSWSVVVKGEATVVDDHEGRARFSQLGLQPWAYGEKPRWVQIRPSSVTGRRILKGAG